MPGLKGMVTMPYSVFYRGEMIDVHFKKEVVTETYSQHGVYVGDDKVGTVWGQRPLTNKSEWTAHADAEDCNMLVEGFRTRRAAREFIIERSKYRSERRNREQAESELIAQKFLRKWNMNKAYEIMQGVENI